MGTKMADVIARITSQTAYATLLAGDKFGFLSAKQYGAKGDGVTDDSAAVLSMLTAAAASTYKALYFPTGVYIVDGVTLTSTHLVNYNCFGDNASFSGITWHIDQIGAPIGNFTDALVSATSNVMGMINELYNGTVLPYISTGTQDQYFTVASTSALTLQAKDSPQKLMTAKGDMTYASAAKTLARLPGSTAGAILSYNYSSSTPEWVKGTAYQTPYINATTNGVEMAASARSVMAGIGDMVTSTAANVVSRVTAGNSSEGKIIQTVNGLPAFTTKLNMTVITSTSGYVWSPPRSGTYEITITGGGGSGACSYTTDKGHAGCGGAGGTAILTTLLSSSESITVTVGAGGVFPNTTNTVGNNGAASSFGAYASAGGGDGGYTNGVTVNDPPTPGGTATGGTINLEGGKGAGPSASDGTGVYDKVGGASFWGGTGAYGSGGTNGIQGLTPSSQLQLAGVNGVCVIRY